MKRCVFKERHESRHQTCPGCFARQHDKSNHLRHRRNVRPFLQRLAVPELFAPGLNLIEFQKTDVQATWWGGYCPKPGTPTFKRMRHAFMVYALYMSEVGGSSYVYMDSWVGGMDMRQQWSQWSIIVDDNGALAGGVVFHWTQSNEWMHGMCWLHPELRGTGFYREKVWPHLRARYGDFFIERPVSDAFRGMLAKMDRSSLTTHGLTLLTET